MPHESKKAKRERVSEILTRLQKRYPDAKCALRHRNPLQLLVATILSAQCTDAKVNEVTEDLFRKYKTPEEFANVSQGALEQDIHSTGFYRNKAKNIRGAAKKIVEEHGGKVPDTMEALLELPGVARKTANVVLETAFGKNEGVIVDTHVIRLSQRLGLTERKDNSSDRMEAELMDLVPREMWGRFSHLLVFHGRSLCTARKPDCEHCPINDLCPSAFKA